MSFYELRQYRIRHGRMSDWLALMDEWIPFLISKGMIIAGSFTDENDPDHYIWIRRFESEEERERLYAACYESDYWLTDVKAMVGEIMIREEIKVTRIVPTHASVLQ